MSFGFITAHSAGFIPIDWSKRRSQERAALLIQEIAAYRDQVKATRAKLYDLGHILARCERELDALHTAAPIDVSDLIEAAALIEDASRHYSATK